MNYSKLKSLLQEGKSMRECCSSTEFQSVQQTMDELNTRWQQVTNLSVQQMIQFITIKWNNRRLKIPSGVKQTIWYAIWEYGRGVKSWTTERFHPLLKDEAYYSKSLHNKPFATLETRRRLEPKCVPQLFLGSLSLATIPGVCAAKVINSA